MLRSLKDGFTKATALFRQRNRPLSEDEIKWRQSMLFTLLYDVHNNNLPQVLEKELELARLPDLECKNVPTHQPLAMCRFLARELYLAGTDEWEAMYIDATVDELCTFKAQMMRILSMSDLMCQRQLRDDLFDRVLPVYLQHLEVQVEKNNGYLIGAKISWADIFFAVIFEQLEKAAHRSLLQTLPKLVSLLHAVLSIPCLQSWKKRRSPSESKLVQLLKI